MADTKLTRCQIEEIEHAMDSIHRVMEEIEESGKNKRVWNALDKCIGILYELVWKR